MIEEMSEYNLIIYIICKNNIYLFIKGKLAISWDRSNHVLVLISLNLLINTGISTTPCLHGIMSVPVVFVANKPCYAPYSRSET